MDGTDPDGKPTHNEWTGKFDGKDYPVTGDPNSDMRSYKKVDDHTLDPVTGDPNSDMRSYKKVDDHTLELTVKKGGKVTTSGRIVVSADGKSRTVTVSGTDPQGKKFKSTAVYDKQ